MCEEGKQFADAPESSAALTVGVVLVGLNVTLLIDVTRSALLVFNIDLGDLVDMLDTEECDGFVVAIVCNDARFQLCIFGPLSAFWDIRPADSSYRMTEDTVRNGIARLSR